MAFLVYLVVVLITVFGVLLESNVFIEPARHIEYAKLPTANAPEPLAQRAAPATDARASQPALPPPPQPATQAISDKCDVTACAAAYHSFRPSDCTYLADTGQRQLCTKGVASDPATAAAVLNSHADVGTSAKCNISACTHAYISFTASDCTYQPSEGPRRLCTK